MSMPPTLSIVVPVFNEENTIAAFVNEINRVFDSQHDLGLEIVFVNDGSRDATLERLLDLRRHDSRIKVVDLSRNFGKESALTAGINLATGQAVVPLDVDLQDPPELILEMLQKWRQGYEVVLGRRIDRKSDSRLKNWSALGFYRLYNKLSSLKIPENVGDFRLMDRQVVEALKQIPESCRFMKGLFAWTGFKTAYVDYLRPPRSAGESKFNGWKLWNLALEGITSFTTLPLRIWSYIGITIAFFSALFALIIFLHVLIAGVDVPGYASLIVAITFLAGLQLLGIGIIGEYLGRTYMEAKRRPIYLVRKFYGMEQANENDSTTVYK